MQSTPEDPTEQDRFEHPASMEEPSVEPIPDVDRDAAADTTYRGSAGDPAFGLLLAGAVSIGLTPFISAGSTDLRYTLTWAMLAGFGVLSWLFGSTARIGQERPENLAWGTVFALILGVPLLAFGGVSLNEATALMFPGMGIGAVLAYLVFVMPLAETLFFRGAMQEHRRFWAVGLIATLWNLVLFFPLIDRAALPLIIGVMLTMANIMYSYVRERNGLAAAWMCQILVNLLIFFVPVVS
jgi:hypothetical protein